MSDEQFHVDISEKLGRLCGAVDALHADVKRINGSVASVTRVSHENSSAIANIRGEARGKSVGWGAGAGAVIVAIIEAIKSFK